MRNYKNYLLTLLLAILASNYVDRLALGLLLQDIKVDLRLSDTQLGFLSGIAFALFYAVMGIPIARWADRGNRITIITLTTGLWSIAVALCGLATNFVQLLLIRIGVAVGEAGCVPPAHSLIADHFSREERPRAVARYMLGGPLSIVIGYFVAGWLNEFFGWRATFILLGLPALVLAALARFTLKEPRTQLPALRQALPARTESRSEESQAGQPSVTQVIASLWAIVTFRHLLLCFSILFFFNYGILNWKPAFFMRSYGLQSGELGTWFAAVSGVGGLLGTYCGGELASRYAASNERVQLNAMAIVLCCFGVISAFIYLSPNHYVAFALMAVATVAGATINGPLFSIIQTLVPPQMRAMSIALTYLFANLIGMGLGPLAAGALSDTLRPFFGEESLRYVLLGLCPGYFWCAWHMWRGSKSVAHDLAIAQGPDQGSSSRVASAEAPALKRRVGGLTRR